MEGVLNIWLKDVLRDKDLVFFLTSLIISFLIYIYKYFPSWLMFLPYLPLTFYYLWEHYAEACARASEKHLPVIFTIEEESEKENLISQAKEAIKKKEGFDKFDLLERYFCVRLENCFFSRRTPQSAEEWRDYIEDGVGRMKYIYQTVPGRRIYHIFPSCPIVLAIGIGALMGRRNEPVVVYQRDGLFRPVLDLSRDSDKVRERRKEFNYVEIERSDVEKSEKIALIAEMTTRSIEKDAKSYIERELGIPAVVVRNKYGGVLREEDWTAPVSELYSVIQDLRESGAEEIHLFFSMPVAMAFGLGYALGPFHNIKVYVWSKSEEYKPAFSLIDFLEFR
jgi:hypothetical protein